MGVFGNPPAILHKSLPAFTSSITICNTEGWGFSILEASAAGTPTVAYDVPGVADAVEDGINGIKVRDGDREALTKAALSILRDPEKWWSSSLEVAKKYSWDITPARWEKLMKELEKKKDKRLNDK